MSKAQLLERFLQYVAIDTMANDETDDYPSSPGQWTLGQLLLDQLKSLGWEAEQDPHGLVWASHPGNVAGAATIAFNSHLDTSPETSAAHVKPQVIESYAGGDLSLPGDPSKIIRVADNPELESLHGCTLITTDGTTLLGGDDKAGLAIIMQLATRLSEGPSLKHGPIKLLFTCDEEIGRGVLHVDVDKLGAVACYTLDGGAANVIDTETFSADLAVVEIRGINIHPSIAKDRMVNAIRAAGEFVARMPADLAPERTDGRDGFLHPYTIEGGVALVRIRVLLRDFDSRQLEDQAQFLRRIASEIEQQFPGASIDVNIQRQYRNMAEGLRAEPRAVKYAELAHRRLGRTPKLEVIRGGTDGSQLTEKGLPTPNLSSGQHNPHSPLEWACLDEMWQAYELLVELVQLWAEDPGLGKEESEAV